MRSSFTKMYNKRKKSMLNSLTDEMLADIKQWRVGRGPDDINTYSWKEIATLFVEKYPEYAEKKKLSKGNQLTGVLLCDSAMVALKETIRDGWN